MLAVQAGVGNQFTELILFSTSEMASMAVSCFMLLQERHLCKYIKCSKGASQWPEVSHMFYDDRMKENF